jgi:hypothetical protein
MSRTDRRIRLVMNGNARRVLVDVTRLGSEAAASDNDGLLSTVPDGGY